MKKRFLSLLMALCLMLTLAPVAFATDTSSLQDLITNDTTGTITLSQDYTLTDTVTISKAVTINGGGHTITYNGSGSAFSVTATAAVVLNNLTVTATSSGAYGISLTSTQPDLALNNVTLNVNNRGINMYPAGGCTNGKLTVQNSNILNSQITDYENTTTVGDTRGIALYGVKDSTITITDSSIKGFGYSVNTSADVGTDGVRPGGNTYNITGSDIWGWSAFNVWSVSNTFNITNSNLRGINRLDSDWNNFATFVINNGIYNGNSSYANQVNITGGTVQAYAYGTAEHADFLESSESITQFAFSKYNNTPVYLIYPEGSTVFAVSYPGTTVNITGAGNVVQIAASNS